MEYEIKLNILARFIYYIEQAKDIPFDYSSYEEQSYVILMPIDTLTKIKLTSLYKH